MRWTQLLLLQQMQKLLMQALMLALMLAKKQVLMQALMQVHEALWQQQQLPPTE